MAEGLKIVIGADVTGAVGNIVKVGKTLKETEQLFADLVDSTGDFAKAIDELGKRGDLSISFLSKQIKDFKEAFANATDPVEAKKFGDALQILTIKQKQLIDSGLTVVDTNKKIAQSHGANVQATSRLSSSFLGLSNIFNALPAEAQHLTHAFEGIVQSFERIGHGTEGAEDKVKKFAGALGQVGLGLAISVAAGLLVGFIAELLHSDEAFIKAAQSAQDFTNRLNDTKTALENLKGAVDLNKDISKLKFEIAFGKDRGGELALENDINKNILFITRANDQVQGLLDDVARKVEEASQVLSKRGFVFFENLLSAPQDARKVAQDVQRASKTIIDKLDETDKAFLEEIIKSGEEIDRIQKEIQATHNENQKTFLQIELDAANKRRAAEKKANDEFSALFKSRLEIIKEFTAKFATIKDPFPSFFTKNLPLGKVEDKGLRAALDNAFKVLEEASRNLFDTKRIDPGTVPLEIHFKPEIVGKTDLVRAIEDNFGDLKKDVEDAVNKGIFEVPIDFKLKSEGDGQALKQAEDLLNDLAKQIESLTGQKNAILDFDFDVKNLDLAKAQKIIEDLKERIAEQVSGTPITASVDANLEVNAKVDFPRLNTQLKTQIADAVNQLQTSLATTIGEALGNALNGLGDAKDAFSGIMNFLADGIKQIGVALIKIGLLSESIQKALAALSIQPELALALGIAFVALSQVLRNSFNTAGRELGGPVQKGIMYLVNEKGREIYEPNDGGKPVWIPGGKQYFQPTLSDGTIIPAHKAEQFAVDHGIKRLADGGVTTGPTFALIGERGPEFVAPIKALNSIGLNGNVNNLNVNVTGQISGNVIKLNQSRTDRSQNRTA